MSVSGVPNKGDNSVIDLSRNTSMSIQDVSGKLNTQNASGTVTGKINERNQIEGSRSVETNTEGSPLSRLDAPEHTPLSPTEQKLGKILGKNIENIV